MPLRYGGELRLWTACVSVFACFTPQLESRKGGLTEDSIQSVAPTKDYDEKMAKRLVFLSPSQKVQKNQKVVPQPRSAICQATRKTPVVDYPSRSQ